ncbi:MAG: hypothetical protein ACFFCF_04315 [Promethearchaeota archaeon]
MKLSLRVCTLLIAVLFITSFVGLQNYTPIAAETDVQITDVQVPNEVAQGSTGQVQATVQNLLNVSLEGFAHFLDMSGEIHSINPANPLTHIVNFTIGPEESLTVIVDYVVNETASVGVHTVTFEISVGGFSFLFEQYSINVVSVVRIVDIMPGSVFSQAQAGLLLVSIENRVDLTKTVRIEVFGPKFVNMSQEVDIAPGMNTVAIPLMPNVTHVYDFGIFPANVSVYFFEELVSSHIVSIPVDMSLVNKTVAIILPVGIFLILVVFYAFRKRQRERSAAVSE